MRHYYTTILFTNNPYLRHYLIMISERSKPRFFSHYIEDLQAHGRYTFTLEEAIRALDISENAFRKAIQRLTQEKRLMRIVNEFYAIIPFEYKLSDGIPATHYLDELMKFKKRSYYVGILSAAELHGAAHQSPQELQVITSQPMPTIKVGRSRIRFFTKSAFSETPVQPIKTPSGYIQVSTPESTALDLLRYPTPAGGLNNIATVLTELSEKIDSKKLARAASFFENCYIQRLGFLLDLLDQKKLTQNLTPYLENTRWDYVRLRAASKSKSSIKNVKWKVIVNEKVESDL